MDAVHVVWFNEQQNFGEPQATFSGRVFPLCRSRATWRTEGSYRPAEIVSLRLVTLVSLKKCQLFLRFHALGNDPQLQASAHADHCGHDGRLVGRRW